jgi:hypothetical protein
MPVGQTACRSVAVAILGVLAVAVGGVGIATAANGGTLVLGHSNAATKTTTLTDSRGTPLSLRAKSGKPALTINTTAKIPHLNADLLDGLSSASLATSGSGVASPSGQTHKYVVPLPAFRTTNPGALVASTAPLSAGTYYVMATAWFLNGNTDGSVCDITVNGSAHILQYGGGVEATGADSATEVAPVKVKKGQVVGEYCFDNSANANGEVNSVLNAGITAIKLRTAKTGRLGKPQA